MSTLLNAVTKIIRCVIYVRVSTDLQAADDKTSLETQLDACRAYARERGWTIVAEYEEDFTGFARDRPEMNKLIASARRGEFDVQLCYTVDRWVRSIPVGSFFLGELKDNDIAVWFVRDNFDFNDPVNGTMFLTFYFWKAERERETFIQRSKEGRKGQVDRGFAWPSARTPYGYTREHGSYTVTVNEGAAAVVRQIFAWTEDGKGLRWITNELGRRGVPSPHGKPTWSIPQVRKMILNPAYKGWSYAYRSHMVHDRNGTRQVARDPSEWTLIDNTGRAIPAIVNEAQWERANAAREATRVGLTPPKRHGTRLLSGRLYCGLCQRLLTAIDYQGRQKPIYSCRHHYRKAGECKGPGRIHQADVEREVKGILDNIRRDPEAIIASVQRMLVNGPDATYEADRKQLEKQQESLTTKLTRVGTRMTEEDDDEIYGQLKLQYKQLREQRDGIEGELERLAATVERQQQITAHAESFIEIARSDPDLTVELSDAQYRDMVEGIDFRMTINGKHPDEWTYTLVLPVDADEVLPGTSGTSCTEKYLPPHTRYPGVTVRFPLVASHNHNIA